MTGALKQFAQKHASLVERVHSIPAAAGELAPWKRRARDPDRLLARWLEGMRFPDESALALSGVGDGSHIKAVLAAMPDSGLVFCAEPDVARFKAFLAAPLAATLMSDPRVVFGVGAIDDGFFSALASLSVMNLENAEPLVFAPLFCEAEDYFADFFRAFAQRIDVLRKLYGTNLTKSGLWQSNSLRNLRTLIRSPDPIEFQNAFDGIPMIMAGAGPSLDESLAFLRWAQDRAVVVAGNSSMRALVNGGVRPHFVLAADPNPSTNSGFAGVEIGETVLICPFFVYPAVVDRFEGRVAAWAGNNLLARYFRQAGGAERMAQISEQGTVSACAFDLAAILGCPALFFVGQDLAVRTDGRMHASDSFYADEGQDRVDLAKCRWVPGNTIEKVPVEEKLFVYLKTFEQFSEHFTKQFKGKNGKGLSLYNLSRQGARIEHMPYLATEAAPSVLESHSSASSDAGWRRVETVLAAFHVGWGRIGKALREFRSYVERICSFSLKEALSLESGNGDLEAVHKAKRKVEAMIAADSAFAEILDNGQLRMELYVHAKVKSVRARRKLARSLSDDLDEAKDYFWAVAEGSYHVLSAIDAAREEETRV